MNCPRCSEMVANDEWAATAWFDVLGAAGDVIGSQRVLTVECQHCGIFEAVEDDERRIRSIVEYHNDRDVARLRRRLAAGRRRRLAI